MATKKKGAAKKGAAKKGAAKKGAAKKSAAKKGATKKSAAKKPARKKVSPIPKGYHAVSAVLNQENASATIDFCKEVFGAKVRMIMPGPDGKIMHSEIVIGDSVVMLTDAVRDPVRVAGLFVYTKDVDATIEKAVQAGATVRMPAENTFWGDRFGSVVDPFGNIWAIATHVEDVSPAEMRKRSKAAMEQMAAGGGS